MAATEGELTFHWNSRFLCAKGRPANPLKVKLASLEWQWTTTGGRPEISTDSAGKVGCGMIGIEEAARRS